MLLSKWTANGVDISGLILNKLERSTYFFIIIMERCIAYRHFPTALLGPKKKQTDMYICVKSMCNVELDSWLQCLIN